MKKSNTTLIIVGVVILVVAIGVTLYFTVFHKPNTDNDGPHHTPPGPCLKQNMLYFPNELPLPNDVIYNVPGADGGASACQEKCEQNEYCNYWSVLQEISGNTCYMLPKILTENPSSGSISGPKVCPK